jgi:hypothetical protein
MFRCGDCGNFGPQNAPCTTCKDPSCHYDQPVGKQTTVWIKTSDAPSSSQEQSTTTIVLPPKYACPNCNETGPENVYCENCDDTRYLYSLRIDQAPMEVPQSPQATPTTPKPPADPTEAFRQAQQEATRRWQEADRSKEAALDALRVQEQAKADREAVIRRLEEFIQHLRRFLLKNGQHGLITINYRDQTSITRGFIRKETVRVPEYKPDQGWVIVWGYSNGAYDDGYSNPDVAFITAYVLLKDGTLREVSGAYPKSEFSGRPSQLEGLSTYHSLTYKLGEHGPAENRPAVDGTEAAIPGGVAELLADLGLTWDGN